MDKTQRAEIRNAFLAVLFEPEIKRLSGLLSVLQDKHQVKHGSRAFLLKGRPIINGDLVGMKQKNKKPLAEELVPEAEIILKGLTKANINQQRIVNFFSMLETRCATYQDFRDAIPDMVVDLMEHPQIRGLPRTRPAGYIFASEPSKMKVYEDTCNIILHYLANRMVF